MVSEKKKEREIPLALATCLQVKTTHGLNFLKIVLLEITNKPASLGFVLQSCLVFSVYRISCKSKSIHSDIIHNIQAKQI